MFVTVEAFGSIWSKRVRRNRTGPTRVRAAFYNTTGIAVGGQLGPRSRFFGQLRFNEIGGFDATLIERNIGQVFVCRCRLERDRAQLLFHHRAATADTPDYFLFTVGSGRTGVLPVGSDDWKSAGVLLLSLSQLKDAQEAIVLMPAHSWIRGQLGLFVAEPEANRPWRAFLRLVG